MILEIEAAEIPFPKKGVLLILLLTKSAARNTGIGFLKPPRFSPPKPHRLATVNCSVSWDEVLQISATDDDDDDTSVNLEGYLHKVRLCNRGSEFLSQFIPFIIENHVVGYIHNRFMDHLRNFPDVFLFFSSNGHVKHGGRFITLHPSLKTPEDRTRAVGDLYPVKSSFDLPVFFSLERAAAPYFGIKAYGVHMNGYVNRSGQKYLWLGRRSDQKPTFPGMLDHLVAGGLPHGVSCKENILKECEEEAGIPRSISTAAIPVGAVSYADIDGYGYKRDVLFCYDLELPDGFVPNNEGSCVCERRKEAMRPRDPRRKWDDPLRIEDGEVDSFRLMPVEHVAKIIQKTEFFKPNCCLANGPKIKMIQTARLASNTTGLGCDAIGRKSPGSVLPPVIAKDAIPYGDQKLPANIADIFVICEKTKDGVGESAVMPMAVRKLGFLVFAFHFLVFFLFSGSSLAGNVTYDHRSLIINGERKLLISASIHYPRSVPGEGVRIIWRICIRFSLIRDEWGYCGTEFGLPLTKPFYLRQMWPGLVATAKEGGIDVIETYVFWNGHEISPGNYYFGGRYDLVKFVKIVQQAGLYLILRIGPFVAAEWNFGGLPVWLHYVPGTVFRTNNEPFKVWDWAYHDQTLEKKSIMLTSNLWPFSSGNKSIIVDQPQEDSGYIILRPPRPMGPHETGENSLIENEYGDIESVYGEGGKPYAMWAANMAVSQDIGVPWIMCQQHDAPDPVINTCNSFYCDQFMPNSPNKPKIWTENWPGCDTIKKLYCSRFKTFGARDPHRPPEDVAYSVARFFQKGGSIQNYYVRDKCSILFYSTEILYNSLSLCKTNGKLMVGIVQYHGGTNFGRTAGGPFITTSYDYDAPIDEYGLPRLPKWGHLKELHRAIKLCEHALLHGKSNNISLGPLQEVNVYTGPKGACSAFIANMDEENDKLLTFRNITYHVPAWSVSILPDCKNVAFNTAKVGSQTSTIEMVPDNGLKNVQWEIFVEKAGIWGEADFVKNGFVDHINTTKDTTDYLWYTTSLYVDGKEEFLHGGCNCDPILVVESKGHALHAFVNQELQVSASGTGTDSTFKFESPITLKAGKNEIALLSMTVGLQNGGPFFEWVGAGLTSVKILGFKNGTIDLSSSTWTYKIGLEGEHLNIFKPDGLKNVKWTSTTKPPSNQPLTWYKAIIDPPAGNEPVGLDMLYMGKGQAWVNGEPIGRYWPRTSSIYDECPPKCNYRGKFMPNKCSRGCGKPTQRWYHVPRSWFKESGNVLVIFEEKGGHPTKVTFSRRTVKAACGLVSEDYPSDLESWGDVTKGNGQVKPTLQLKCPENTLISSIRFASFGTPNGACGSYQKGSCHDPNSISAVEKMYGHQLQRKEKTKYTEGSTYKQYQQSSWLRFSQNVCLNKNGCAVTLSKENFNQDLCPGTTKALAIEAVCG
ncbi:Beta-galactosidase 10 [Asimina triloba]